MSVMQSGTQMVKLKAGSKGLVRLFYLDEHRSCIRWKPSRKSEKAKSEYAWTHTQIQEHIHTLSFCHYLTVLQSLIHCCLWWNVSTQVLYLWTNSRNLYIT